MVTPPDVRSHGFERPLDAHQLSSWYFLALVVVSFFVLYTPVEVGAEGITVDCIYAILVCTTFYAGVMSMGIDPSDDGALKARKAAAAGLPDAEPPPPDATNHCGLCDAFVLKRSKHCRRCNKCVDTFDHHCPWLNTCVGRKNYPHFIGLLCSVFALTTVHISAFVHSGVRQIWVQSQRDQLADVYGGLSSLAYGIILIVLGVLIAPAMMLVFQLLSFHLGLIRRGMTTYEFIMAQRKKEKEWAFATGPETRQHKLIKWINRNAPCIAVCLVCDEPPTAASTKPQRVPSWDLLRQQLCFRASKPAQVQSKPCTECIPIVDHVKCRARRQKRLRTLQRRILSVARTPGKLSDRPLRLSCEMLLLHLQPQLLQQLSQHQWLEPMHSLVQKPSSRRCRPRDARLMRVLYKTNSTQTPET
ncbi:dhhc zinc finger [Chrysochromulina tobinii]|uniref:Palmitoyltransferase n=1 Tax=Chrysochromulina tobinii TaxID=1460289 RepID=A0A0M0JW20_9EUKA|nr:dhhc zinc finger [Chrysochromulina tobinii]|eukprot:KOO30467.1 dhhc zinc finger [Chrysochromulina sp. CCMP291]